MFIFNILTSFASDLKEIKPYDENNTDKKTEVTAMFDNIAPYYDLLNRVLSVGIDTIWRKKAIAQLDKSKCKRILDIATGTADLAVEISKQLPESQIIGLDISSKMIDLAGKKITKKHLQDRIQVEVGDSENLRFEDNSFDATTASFGVRNFGNLVSGLKEMYRILKPGGQIVILEFSRPRVFPFKQLFNTYFKYILPVIGRVKSKDPKAYKYLYESVQHFPDYDQFGDLLKEVGFNKVSWKPLSFGICTIYLGEK